jgi:hypothetical protein
MKTKINGLSFHAVERLHERFPGIKVKDFLAFPRRLIVTEAHGDAVWAVECGKPPAYIVVAPDGTVKTVLPADYIAGSLEATPAIMGAAKTRRQSKGTVRGGGGTVQTVIEKVGRPIAPLSKHDRRERKKVDPTVRQDALKFHMNRADQKKARQMGMTVPDYLSYMQARRECILAVTKLK